MSEVLPPRTHNQPKLAELIPPDVITMLIADEVRPLRERADELIASCKRFAEAYPVIETPDQDAKAAEVLAVVQRFISKSGRVETARVALKAPILAADTAIGSLLKGPFAGVAVSVEAASQAISRASITYKQKVETERRRKAQEEADNLAAQARLVERMAQRGAATMGDAIVAAEASETAQKVADSKPAELTRTHGDGVGTTSLRYKRVVTILAPADVPRMYCVPDPAALTRAAGKAGTPIPVIAGCEVKDVPDLTVRR